MNFTSVATSNDITKCLKMVPDPVAMLSGFFKNAPFALQVFKVNGFSLLVNNSYIRLFGSEPPPNYNVINDRVAAKKGVLDLIQRSFKGETATIPMQSYDLSELVQVTANIDKRIFVEATYFPISDARGVVAHVGVIYKEGTSDEAALEKQKNAESAFDCYEAHFQALFNSPLVGVAFTGFSGKIFKANDAFLKITGYDKSDLATLDWRKLTAPEYRHQTEKEYIRKDGSRVPVLVEATQIKGVENRCATFVFDLTILQNFRVGDAG